MEAPSNEVSKHVKTNNGTYPSTRLTFPQSSGGRLSIHALVHTVYNLWPWDVMVVSLQLMIENTSAVCHHHPL